jgi:hypothetical protein
MREHRHKPGYEPLPPHLARVRKISRKARIGMGASLVLIAAWLLSSVWLMVRH